MPLTVGELVRGITVSVGLLVFCVPVFAGTLEHVYVCGCTCSSRGGHFRGRGLCIGV